MVLFIWLLTPYMFGENRSKIFWKTGGMPQFTPVSVMIINGLGYRSCYQDFVFSLVFGFRVQEIGKMKQHILNIHVYAAIFRV